MIRFRKAEWLILSALFIYSFIPVVGSLLRLQEIAGGPTIVPENPRVTADPLPAVLHLTGVILFCYLGALQFLSSIRRHAPDWHRISGKIVAFSGIISALSGAWMTHFYAFPAQLQGTPLYYARMIVSAGMMLFIILGVMAARRKKLADHRSWMIRAYAIGLGASTQGFLGLTWLLLSGTEAVDTNRDILMISAWLINLVIAERIVRKY